MQHSLQQGRETDFSKEARAGGTTPHSRELDDEIDLRKYILVAIKRKKIIIGVSSVAVLFAILWGILVPKLYEVSMIIEPPVNAITDTGLQNFDSGASIKALIESGVYNIKILNELNLQEGGLSFKASLTKDTNLIKVNLNVRLEQAEKAKQLLSKLLEHLSLGYAKIIEDKRSRVDNQIKTILNQINTKENEIKLKNEHFKITETRAQQLNDEIREAKINLEKMVVKREAVFTRDSNKDDTATLFYAATIQQNISYFAQLQNDLSDARNKKESLLSEILNLKNSINIDQIRIGDLNLLKEDVRNIRVMQDPNITRRPLESNNKRNVLVVGVVSLIVGLLLAFTIEWWESSSIRS